MGRVRLIYLLYSARYCTMPAQQTVTVFILFVQHWHKKRKRWSKGMINYEIGKKSKTESNIANSCSKQRLLKIV